MDRVYAAITPALHCPGHTSPPLHGTGFYANEVPQSWQRPPVPDIRARLRNIHLPALVIKGQCDYVDWQTAAAYVTTLPGAELAYLHGAGHDIKTRPTRRVPGHHPRLPRRPAHPPPARHPTPQPRAYQPNQ